MRTGEAAGEYMSGRRIRVYFRVACRVLDANRNSHLTNEPELFQQHPKKNSLLVTVTDYSRLAFLQLSAGSFKFLGDELFFW